MKASEVKGRGYSVESAKGSRGRTMHSDKPINGKIPVYLYKEGTFDLDSDDKGEVIKLLCDPNSLKIKGFID
jgi:hypothetical protein